MSRKHGIPQDRSIGVFSRSDLFHPAVRSDNDLAPSHQRTLVMTTETLYTSTGSLIYRPAGAMDGGLGRGPGDRKRPRLVNVCAALAIAGVFAAAAQEHRPVDPPAPILFHIPSQPLANALQSYGEQAGVQVLYESHSASGQQSVAVQGNLTPEDALNRLLSGTNLRVRYTRSDAITLAPRVSEQDIPPASPFAQADLSLGTLRVHAGGKDDSRSSLRDYSESVQIDIQRALQKNPRTRAGSYKATLDLWIDPSRTIQRTQLLQSTGDADRDAAVAAALRGVVISRPAPASMPQPVRVAIVVRGAP